MLRLCCQLLLILSLVCNGIGAPWAMTRMHHGGHGGHDGASTGHVVPDAHAHHHSAMQDASHAMPDEADHGCCGTSQCRCGCVLPALVPLSIAFALPQALPIAPPQRAVVGHVAVRGTPPFRPPA